LASPIVSTPSTLNSDAGVLCDEMVNQELALGIRVSRTASGTRLIDCGVAVSGSLEAGRYLARVCLAGRARVEWTASHSPRLLGPAVMVVTDSPMLACMASQYAGWEVKEDQYFAMGSGPMRAAAAREPLFEELGYREQARQCVGVLESAALPPDELCCSLAEKCGVAAADLTLLVAPTRSQAGTVQVVARSVETALHKLHELGFDLTRIVSGWGVAPLPPTAKDDLAGIGRTNDAILYGGSVVLWVRGDDASLQELGPRLPSSASRDYGRPFGEVLASYGHDFYQVDPLLFSPAQLALVNLDSGHTFRYGERNDQVLASSFGL
jgi:methenyltetrahydromethanopterin cyclohydrolase